MATSTSFTKTPQAGDDFYYFSESIYGSILMLDVMANDLGGKAKTLYSLADGTTSTDLLDSDARADAAPDHSALGATIRIVDGKVSYDTSTMSDLNSLAAGETVEDTFTYAIRMGNGTLSWATVTITYSGENDAPVIAVKSGDSDAKSFGEDDALAVSGTLSVNDVDTSDVVDSLVTGVNATGDIIGNPDFASMFTLTNGFDDVAANVGDSGNLHWSFDAGAADFNYLKAGEHIVIEYQITSSDFSSDGLTARGGSATHVVRIVIDGTNDLPMLTGTAASLASGVEDTAFTVSLADLLEGWTDADHDTTLAIENLAADHGTVSDNGDGTYTVTPDADYNGPLVLTYDVVDGEGGSSAASLSLELVAVNDAALVSGIVTGAVYEDGVSVAGGSVSVSDVDGPAEESVKPGTHYGTYGSLVIDAAGAWTYTLNPAASGLDTLDTGESEVEQFELETADGTTFTIEVTVHGNDEPIVGVIKPEAYTGGNDPNDFDTLVGTGPVNNNLVISGTNGNDNITGGAGGQTITGGNGNDTIYGGGGNDNVSGGNNNDWLYGQAGNDVIHGNNHDDHIFGGSGDDTLYGDNHNDVIYGGSGADIIFGNDGDDIIIGGYGADTLTGGGGNDTFRYLSELDTNDIITDFGDGADVIDLSAIDANSLTGLNDALVFGGTTATANGVWYEQSGLDTLIYIDTDGDVSTAEMMITLQNYDSVANALTVTDFVL